MFTETPLTIKRKPIKHLRIYLTKEAKRLRKQVWNVTKGHNNLTKYRGKACFTNVKTQIIKMPNSPPK